MVKAWEFNWASGKVEGRRRASGRRVLGMKRMAPAPHSRSLLAVALVLALTCYAGVELVQPHKKGNASSVAEAATKAERSDIDIIDSKPASMLPVRATASGGTFP